MTPDILLAWAVTVVGVGGGVWATVKKILPALRRVSHFFDDWFGEPPREGMPEGSPGIIGRLNNLSQRLHIVEFQLQNLDRELHPPNRLLTVREVLERVEHEVTNGDEE